MALLLWLGFVTTKPSEPPFLQKWQGTFLYIFFFFNGWVMVVYVLLVLLREGSRCCPSA